MNSWRAFLATTVLASGLQTANASEVFTDPTDGFRPRCIARTAAKNIFLNWDEDELYYRDVRAHLSSQKCENWEKVISNPLGWRVVKPTDSVIFDEPLTPGLSAMLAQVRAGATVARREQTADEFVSRNGVTKYTRELNETLTAKYGMAFSGDVYRSTLYRDRANQRAHSAVSTKLKGFSHFEVSPKVGSNTVVLVASGFGMDAEVREDSMQFAKDFISEMPRLGVNIRVMSFNPIGVYQENAELFAAQIREVLLSGKDVVVIGASKGVADALGGVALAFKGQLGEGREQLHAEGVGKLLGFVNLCGLVDGTFMADFAKKLPAADVFLGVLRKTSIKFNGHNIGDYLQSTTGLSRDDTAAYMRDVWSALPSDVSYLTVVNILTDYSVPPRSYAKGDELLKLTRTLKATRLANDTLIEFPGNEIPSWVAPRNAKIVFNSTHMIYDGYFEGRDLTESKTRIAMNKALLETVVELGR